jgi:hypothetical protein
MEGLQVRKNPLRGEMSDAVFVDEAAGWARQLTQSEARGPGDLESAWRRLEARYGVPWRTFWALRYRKPNEIATSLYARLQAAYRAECERQMRRLQHELEITERMAGADHPAVVAAKAVVGKAGGKAAKPELSIDPDDPMEPPAFLRRAR